MNENYENLNVCRDAQYGCRYDPNPCCRYKRVKKFEAKPCGKHDCFYWNENYWTWEKPGLSRYVLSLLIQFLIQLLILMLIENNVLRQIRYWLFKSKRLLNDQQLLLQSENEEFYGDIKKDSDVIQEENRVSNILTDKNYSDIFVIDQLTKYYADFIAVKGISFGINSTDCFGLLGVNGAGKTSTFKMITGDEFITKGNAYLNNTSIKNDVKKV